MGSVTNFDEKCPRCGKNNMFEDYYYKTGEGSYSCNACGMYHRAFFKHNHDGNVVMKDTEYPLDGNLVMAVRAYRPYKFGHEDEKKYDHLPEAGKILWEMPIEQNMKVKDIDDFMFPKTKIVYKKKNPLTGEESLLTDKDDMFSGINTISHVVMVEPNPLYAETYNIEYGTKNLFYRVNDEYKQLWYIGNNYRFETDSEGKIHFFVEEAVWDIEDSGGYGVITIWEKPTKKIRRTPSYSEYFQKPISAEEALNIWNSHISNKLDPDESYLTIWNEQENTLVCLKGTIPDSNFLVDEEGNKHQ